MASRTALVLVGGEIQQLQSGDTLAGAGGSPGGSNPQVQYNNSGAFGGASQVGVTSNGNLQLTQATSPTSPGDGEVFYGTEKALTARLDGLTQRLVGCLYTMAADGSVTGTTEATLTNDTNAIGTRTLPANALAVGKTLRVRAYGYATAGNGGTLQIKLKAGSTVLLDTGAKSGPMGQTSFEWLLDAIITCRATGASGSVMPHGLFHRYDANIGSMDAVAGNTGGAVTLDTTASQALDVTATMGTSGNTLKCSNLTIEALN